MIFIHLKHGSCCFSESLVWNALLKISNILTIEGTSVCCSIKFSLCKVVLKVFLTKHRAASAFVAILEYPRGKRQTGRTVQRKYVFLREFYVLLPQIAYARCNSVQIINWGTEGWRLVLFPESFMWKTRGEHVEKDFIIVELSVTQKQSYEMHIHSLAIYFHQLYLLHC